jgi:hypothetical protein
MEKMKVWLAYFDVAYEGYFEMKVFSKEEDAWAYLDERLEEMERAWGGSVYRVVDEMEVK